MGQDSRGDRVGGLVHSRDGLTNNSSDQLPGVTCNEQPEPIATRGAPLPDASHPGYGQSKMKSADAHWKTRRAMIRPSHRCGPQGSPLPNDLKRRLRNRSANDAATTARYRLKYGNCRYSPTRWFATDRQRHVQVAGRHEYTGNTSPDMLLRIIAIAAALLGGAGQQRSGHMRRWHESCEGSRNARYPLEIWRGFVVRLTDGDPSWRKR